MANEKLSGLTVKIDVDVSEALTGLKALQREAKEATKALRELDAEKNVDNPPMSYGEYVSEKLSPFNTNVIAEELARREGVREFVLAPHEEHATINFYKSDGSNAKYDVPTPSIIYVVTD